jgi:hypothetical protein
MQFYVIPPVDSLHLMEQGDRIFVLAHLWIQHPQYREFVLDKKNKGWYITLDNSAAEKELVTEDILINIVKDLEPDEVISPDVLFDSIATIRNLESFINRMTKENLLGKVKVFGCPQGANYNEWIWVYKYMLCHPHVDVIGFSKIAVPHAFLGLKNDQGIMEARHLAYDTLKAQGLIQKPIHLLGMGSPLEMTYYLNDPLMRSTDSCNTVWSGMNAIVFEQGNFERIPTPKDYFERSINLEETMYIESNIEWFKNLLHNK